MIICSCLAQCASVCFCIYVVTMLSTVRQSWTQNKWKRRWFSQRTVSAGDSAAVEARSIWLLHFRTYPILLIRILCHHIVRLFFSTLVNFLCFYLVQAYEIYLAWGTIWRILMLPCSDISTNIVVIAIQFTVACLSYPIVAVVYALLPADCLRFQDSAFNFIN